MGRPRAPFLLAAALAAAALPLTGGAQESPAPGGLTLGLPIDCALGRDCYIQQYVDRDPGPGVRDVGCGTLANDGHKGTDFAVPSEAAMAQGVPVIAAAPGVVRGVRDEMPDIAMDAPGAPPLEGRDCGNGVLLDHGDGWETQYCHLRLGSVSVRPGDRVAEGDRLGLVGMSGAATFPHVHLSVRREGTVIDPFRPDAAETCGAGGPAPLWREPLPYRPGGLIAAGLIDRVPEFAEIEAGLPEDALPAGAGAVVLWAYVYAGRAGDVIALEIDGPEGTIGREEMTLERDQPQLFRAWGRRAPDGGWPGGAWSGTVTHLRGGTVLDSRRVDARLP